MRRIILAIALLAANVAWGCQFDTDCNARSTCLKDASSIYGVCAGGIHPGNSGDRKPVYSPTDPNRTVGNTCQFNTDCGPGSKCLKSSSSIYGFCAR